MERVALVILIALTACSNQVTAVPTPIYTAAITPIPSPTLTLTLTPITATVASGDEVVNVVTGEVYGHEIKFEMEDSYLVKNENTVMAVTDALLTALRQGEYADKGFVSNEEFIKWIYSDENPAGPGKLAWLRPVDDPGFVHQENHVDNKVVWEEQPVWVLDNGIVWETDFIVKRVAAGEGKPETPSWRNKEVTCVAIVDEQSRLHVYAAQEAVALQMAHPNNSDSENLLVLQDIPADCLAYFQVVAHHADGENAVILGYTATPFPTLRQQAQTWFDYDINWGQE